MLHDKKKIDYSSHRESCVLRLNWEKISKEELFKFLDSFIIAYKRYTLGVSKKINLLYTIEDYIKKGIHPGEVEKFEILKYFNDGEFKKILGNVLIDTFKKRRRMNDIVLCDKCTLIFIDLLNSLQDYSEGKVVDNNISTIIDELKKKNKSDGEIGDTTNHIGTNVKGLLDKGNEVLTEEINVSKLPHVVLKNDYLSALKQRQMLNDMIKSYSVEGKAIDPVEIKIIEEELSEKLDKNNDFFYIIKNKEIIKITNFKIFQGGHILIDSNLDYYIKLPGDKKIYSLGRGVNKIRYTDKLIITYIDSSEKIINLK